MNKLYLISCGTGQNNITVRALDTIKKCDMLTGVERLLKEYAGGMNAIPSSADPCRAAELINSSRERDVGLLLSGDAGFYSLATGIRSLILNREIITIPGVGVVQSVSAKLNISWQEMNFISLHASEYMPELNASENYLILTRKGLKIDEYLERSLLAVYDAWILSALYTDSENIEPWCGTPYECSNSTVIALITKTKH